MKFKKSILKYQLFLVLYSLVSLTGCDQFEFSPNQNSDQTSPLNLNLLNAAKLRQSADDDTVTIVFSGDSQRWYDEQERFVNKVNTLSEVDLVLLAGDISDFGLLQEFKWVHKRLSGLHAPYIGVVGNHDLVGNGRAVFEKMFGPLNYSFVYRGIKFIAHNTNGLESPGQNVPDLNWLIWSCGIGKMLTISSPFRTFPHLIQQNSERRPYSAIPNCYGLRQI
jgi:3',5'-cyclic-AMP phosphodiesterase